MRTAVGRQLFCEQDNGNVKMDKEKPQEYPEGGFERIDFWSRILLSHARKAPNLLGRKSAFRKFCRRNLGLEYLVQTNFGFLFSGEIGDSVDNQIAVWGEFEPDFSRFMANHAHQWQFVVDLGCNIGYFSCLLKALNPDLQVLAIDANKQIIARCEKNLELNHANAAVENCAIGAEPGHLIFSVPKNRHSLGTLGTFADKSSAEVNRFEVEVKRLDDVISGRFPQIDFLKVDIEGFEAEVFKSFSPELTGMIRSLAFEYSEHNLRNCGFKPSAFQDVDWLDDFDLSLLDESSGEFQGLEAISKIGVREGTVLAVNKKHNK